MPLTFLRQPVRAATPWRMALVLCIVLGLHACALYEVTAGLSTLRAEDATQTTLAVSLITPPPPPPVVAATPVPTRPPRPRSAAAPSLPVPPASSTPAPAEPAPPPPPPLPPPPPQEETPAPPPPAPVVEEPRLPPAIKAVPTKGRIVYRTKYTRLRGITALTFVDWSVDPERARYEIWLRVVDPSGLLDLKSSGTLQPFGIAPERYVERIEIANRELRAEFDWTARVVTFNGRGAGQPAGFPEGTQDPLSLQFHLPLLAQAYPWQFTPGSELRFQIARRDIETYVFKVGDYEAIRISNKDVKALRIERPRGPNSNRRIEMWLAPEYQWLPVRMRFTDTNDEVWDSVLAALPGEEQPREPIVQEVVKP